LKGRLGPKPLHLKQENQSERHKVN